MQTYIGSKIVNAIPMNRLQYNNFRGWVLPSNENGEDEGYLVEYTDGGSPNTPHYKGYVSWSPKIQFENAYKVISIPENLLPYQQRVVIEYQILARNRAALNVFINSELFDSVDSLEQNRMEKQSQLMYELERVLQQRIDHF